MTEYSIKTAFKNPSDYNAYDYFVCRRGKPREYAKRLTQDPAAMLADFADYFDDYRNLKIAAIADTDGSYAIPMACLGAEITIFGVSEEAKKYAEKTAEAAETAITYETEDFINTDVRFFNSFDTVLIKGSVIHYFYDIEKFFSIVRSILKPDGRLICIDFQPKCQQDVCIVRKHRYNHIHAQMPEVSLKRFSLTEILREISCCGLKITSLNEKKVQDGNITKTAAILTAEKINN